MSRPQDVEGACLTYIGESHILVLTYMVFGMSFKEWRT